MYYIEYNVTANGGRKRGYVESSALTKCGSKTLNSFWRSDGTTTIVNVSQSYNVYQVLNPNIETFATINAGDQIRIFSRSNVNGLYFSFVSFTDRRAGSATYGQLVTGYILR